MFCIYSLGWVRPFERAAGPGFFGDSHCCPFENLTRQLPKIFVVVQYEISNHTPSNPFLCHAMLNHNSNMFSSRRNSNRTGGIRLPVVFLLAATALASCTDSVGKAGGKAPAYFDLKGYFATEIQRLETWPKAAKVEKTTVVNGLQELREFQGIDFNAELSAFSKSDINRPAWSDKFAVDSVFNTEKQLVRIDYRSNDEKLNTKHVSIDFEQASVSRISIENQTSTAVADTRQLLTYLPANGYTIESYQKTALGKPDEFKVAVVFIGL